MAKLYKTTGEVVEITPAEKHFTLEEMYKHIGCNLVTMVSFKHPELGYGVIIADDEGLLKPNPIHNDKASEIFKQSSPTPDRYLHLYGNVIICLDKDKELNDEEDEWDEEDEHEPEDEGVYE